MAHRLSYATLAHPPHVPGLAEKTPYWLTESKPNCYACKENYADRPLFTGCEECIGAFEGLELSTEELFAVVEGSRPELPELVRDPIGGLILPLITKF